jgi:HEPN domain-containing protein
MKAKTRAWIDFARRDLAAAEKLDSDESFSNIVLFHCQQCIEKSLKALFEEHDLPVLRINATVKLHAELRKAIPSIPCLAENADFGFIDDVYLDSRYPGGRGMLPSGLPTRNETARGLRIARRVLAGAERIKGELFGK